MTTKWYSPKEVAQTLGISATTLRVWVSLFGDALSPAAAKPPQLPNGQRGTRVYSDSDLIVLSRVSELLRQGLTYQQVAEALNVRHTTSEARPQPSAPEQAIAAPPAAIPTLSDLMDVLQVIASQKERLDHIEARMIEMEKRLAEEYALLSNYLFLSQSRRSGRWNRYLVWHQSRAVYRFYLGPASEQEIKHWQEHVMGLYLESNVAR